MSVLWLLLGLLVSGPQATQQEGGWNVFPVSPTVGDTVWLERHFTLPPGWRLRPGRLASSEEIEALGEPVLDKSGGDWVVRYPVTAWSPGPHAVTLPPLWRLGPDAQADSVDGGTASFALRSVIPDTTRAPAPRPGLAPLRSEHRDPRPVLIAALGAAISLAGALWWRTRPPRARTPGVPPAPAVEVSDARWLDAGESKAVAARAAGRLRAAVARLVPEAHAGLSTIDCLDAVQRHRPQTPIADLAAALEALDQIAFSSGSASDVATLAAQARRLAESLKP